MFQACKGSNPLAYFAINIIEREKKVLKIELSECSRPIRGETL
jgi:hypothetical protein